MTLNKFYGKPCPECGDFSPRGTPAFPFCGWPCKVYSEGGLIALLEYAKERAEFAPGSSVALDNVKAAISLAVRKIREGEGSE